MNREPLHGFENESTFCEQFEVCIPLCRKKELKATKASTWKKCVLSQSLMVTF